MSNQLWRTIAVAEMMPLEITGYGVAFTAIIDLSLSVGEGFRGESCDSERDV
jgi:hypothetical protein